MPAATSPASKASALPVGGVLHNRDDLDPQGGCCASCGSGSVAMIEDVPRSLPSEWSDLLNFQLGVFTRAQAADFGITDAMIRAQLAACRWQRLYPGTFVAHNGRFDFRGRAWAAVLCCGGGALASHRTAAYLASLLDTAPPTLEVSVPVPRQPRGHPGIVVRRRRTLPAGVGSPPRTPIDQTVLDLVDTAHRPDDAVAALTAACQRRLSTVDRLAGAARRRPRLRWRSLVLDVLDDGEGVHSALEWRYRRDVERAHGLPRGERQVRVAGRSALWRDVLYARYGVVVELDGAGAHPAEARHRDMARDNGVVVGGGRPLRYGWPDVAGAPCLVAGQVCAVLISGGWSGEPRRCGGNCTMSTAA